ncbi:MAG: 23S rRNA (guanosine(2251)-2'-O)-methyltransferase RlmB, partial [Jiangellaceae bacterium]
MAGNSQRRGAMRKSGTKKGMVVGSGGQRRRGLKGKKATPRAESRSGHPAARRAAGWPKEGTQAGQSRPGAAETVAGRNAAVEALRAGIPISALYVAERVDGDDRVREALSIAARRGLPR